MRRTMGRIRMGLSLVGLAALLCMATPGASAAPEGAGATTGPTLLLQQPAISKDHVAFVYAHDLWIVGREGGTARRLTSHVGQESSPRFSPDGRWIAFTAHYEGNMDVYAIPVEGGSPKRLTWHPERDIVRGWHPDGERVLFCSRRSQGPPVTRLFHVPLAGGTPEALPLPRAVLANWNHDGSRLAYTPISDATTTWKRYRGGRTGPVWIYDPKTHDIEVVPHRNATDTHPWWIGDTLYFVSDRRGMMELWRFQPGSEKVENVQQFDTFGIQYMTAGAGVLVYARGGALWVHDPKVGSAKRLDIRCPTDGLGRNPYWKTVGGAVRNATISPNGKRVAFEARGEIVTVPREHGAPRNLTKSPGAHDRDPVWSPDGARIAWFSDESGEYRLHVTDRLGREPAAMHELGGAGFYHDPVWSPDGKHILYNDKANRLAYLTLDGSKVTEIAKTQGSLGVWRPFGVWSPDSKWIAFERRDPDTTYNGVSLFEVATGKTTSLTDDFANADSPAFSPDGKHLFFRASVDSGPKQFGLDMSASASRRTSSRLYVCVLRKKGKNPLAPKSDDETPKKKKAPAKKDDPKKDDKDQKDADKDEKKDDAPKKEGDDKEDAKDGEKKPDGKKEEKPKPPSIDIDGIDQRVLALPIGSGRYWGLHAIGKRLLFMEVPDGGQWKLKSFDFDSRKSKDIVSNIRGVEVAAGGKHLLLHIGSAWAITNESGGARKNLAISRVRVRVDPALEWRQILRETWRLQRDYFYDPAMHGVDWDAMWERWSGFLPHVQHRADLSLLQREMIGELCCGHEYVSGGEMPRAPSAIPVGLLGADTDIHEGRHRITRIYRGQNWNPGLRAPLTEPGVDARVGDHILEIDGRDVSGAENLFAFLEGTSGRAVELVLSEDAAGTKRRTTTVVPVSSDSSLRRMAWIEQNRRRVAERSKGRLAYIYMPDTGGRGMRAFDRDYYSQLDKEGLVLDERFNGGGKVADYVISVLARKVHCYWMNREGWLGRTPFGTLDGPKVMVINERAGSGGDAMPWMFKKNGIGTLVGTRTWGGLVGISGYPTLMDGGSVTAASFGIMDTDGKWVVENEGVAPDVEVIQRPKDVIEGKDPQLDKAIDIALEQLATWPRAKRPGYTPPTKR